MARIHLLDDRLISQIAAGEVIERPASVVKELVENALDAEARDVSIELEAGGKRRIVVADDGVGMSEDDALLAFDRHATSKIAVFDDLEQVATLGFRGEALATVAAVARVELRTAETPGDGHRVRIEGGRMVGVEPVAHPRGTRLEVASLFYNVPARRKFLKRPATELRRCVEVVQGYALARADVRFEVQHAGRTLLEAPPSARDDALAPDALRERIAQVFGRELSERLLEIPADFTGEEEAITGFVGDRGTTSGRRVFTYVNRRLIKDRALMARFYRAVRDAWKDEAVPALFLFVELRPDLVDVNVHPQKAEVRFRDASVIDRVEDALRAALDAHRGAGDAPLSTPRSLPHVPTAWEGMGGRYDRTLPAADEIREPAAHYDAAWHDRQALDARQDEQDGRGVPTGSTAGGALPPSSDGGGWRPRVVGPPPPGIARPTFAPIRPSSSPLGGRGGSLPPFRLLGQYKGSLILLEGHDGLYLVDQHAAHERLLYERLRRAMAARTPASQNLLQPLLLEMAPAEAMRLSELVEPLERCGFVVRPMSGSSLALVAKPELLDIERAEALLLGLASGDAVEVGDDASAESETAAEVEGVRRRLLEELAADMSCKAAIKIHRPLRVEEMEALVSELFDAEQPYACPHGRPTVLFLGDGELERKFGRRG
ncbi:MAG: DNA mismatch repair endonuclease MutL [Acidobacteriota bacterium]